MDEATPAGPGTAGHRGRLERRVEDRERRRARAAADRTRTVRALPRRAGRRRDAAAVAARRPRRGLARAPRDLDARARRRGRGGRLDRTRHALAARPLGPALGLVAGGNGSGKTTLVKILCGLYAPHEGQILLNDIPITQDKKKWFREHLAVVFSDFHLFENLAGMLASQLESQVNQFQKELHLDKKVALTNGVYRFNGLSHGQRQRLALLLAFIDDRPIYLFDEWAADQDPYFKDFFYYKFLPELKNRGKSAIVITHDDRYFQVGDRIMKMENGQLIASPEQ